MEKVRVYELAKELNTTSKRLIEKLDEINIEVKNHMSFINKHELEALYDHIGVIRHDESEGAKSEENQAVSKPKPEPAREVKRDVRSGPRIIRTTQIVIDTKDEDSSPPKSGTGRGGRRGGSGRRDTIKVAAASSGLRAGFVRDNRADYLKEMESYMKSITDKEIDKETVKPEPKQDEVKRTKPKEEQKTKKAQKTRPAKDVKQDTKSENKAAVKAEAKAAVKAEAKAEAKAGVEPEVKTEVQKEAKPETKAETKPVEKEKTDAAQQEMQKKDVAHKKRQDKDKGMGKRKAAKIDEKLETEAHKGTKEHKTGDRKQETRVSKKAQAVYPVKETAGLTQEEKPGYKETAKTVPASSKTASKVSVKPLDIPKPELFPSQKEEISSKRIDAKREFQHKDILKTETREQRRDIQRTQAEGRTKRFKPQNIIIEGKKGLSETLSDDFIIDNFYPDGSAKKSRRPTRPRKDLKSAQPVKHIPPKAVLTQVTLPESITVKALAETLKKTSADVIKKLMGLGLMAALNQEVDFDTAAIVADEFGIKAEKAVVVTEEDILFDDSEGKPGNMKPRPPVVVVMGHVDHGKTSLLDAIREANVIESEAGGITQHIGAYTVKINNRNITFLDTPGHEAFTAMRARGAQVTDVAILVVAADDGVMPQTVEAINHAKAAGVSIIVAINKIDKPGANPDRVKQQLAEYGLVPEEWGGDAICVPVSAKNKQNIEQLLEMVLLTADILELKADPDMQAKGTVIEAKLDKNRGPIATLLVQRGTLNTGDSVITGVTIGRIRAMVDDMGNTIKEAGPSTPVEILGLPEVPEAGEVFYAINDEKVARQLAEKRRQKHREEQLKSSARVSLDDLFKQIQEDQIKELNIIIKADVQGSVEAVKQSLEKLSNDEVHIKVIHDGVGAITESDVALAQVSNAIIIGFNVRPGANVTEAAENANVDIRLYRVIYNAIEDIEAAMKGLLDPKYKELILGHAEIRQTFKASGLGTIGGCYVTDGKILRNSNIRLVRDGIVVHEGRLASLKRFKDDAREVTQGFECGVLIEKFNDIKEGDIVEAFTMEEIES